MRGSRGAAEKAKSYDHARNQGNVGEIAHGPPPHIQKIDDSPASHPIVEIAGDKTLTNRLHGRGKFCLRCVVWCAIRARPVAN